MSKKLNESIMQRHRLLLEYSIRDGQAPSGDSYYGGDKRVELKEEDPAGASAQGYQKKGAPGADPAAAPAPEADPAATPAPDAAPAPQAPADAMIPDMDGLENPDASAPAEGEVDMVGKESSAASADDPNESREDIISQLIQLHSDKLKGLEEFAMQMSQRAQGYDAAAASLPEVEAKIGQLEAQVEELTPDTPLQAMANVPSDLGGTTPEDWWNSYWAEKNQNKQLSSSPYYPQQKGDLRQQAQAAPVGSPDASGGKEGQQPVYYMKASELPDLNQDQAKDSFAPKTSY